MPNLDITIHKFGGTSLQTAEHYRHIADLLAGADEPTLANTTGGNDIRRKILISPCSLNHAISSKR